jgi:hypothetical protein
MTAGRPTRWVSYARRAGLAAAACAALAGCKVFDRGGGSGGGLLSRGGDRPDPLLGSRIPATDLPVPGRGEGYGKGAKDPLLGLPTGRGERSSRADDREPFRLGPGDTAPGLAGRMTPGDTGLSIGERPRDGGPVPLRPADGGSAGGLSYTQITDALKRFDARWAEPVQEGGSYVFRADVPIEGGADGAVRRYEGTGSTPAAAAKQVLDQVKEDRGL